MNVDVLSNLNQLAASHARVGQPEAVFRAVDQLLVRTVSHKFITILMYDAEITESIRVYSSLSDSYPPGGRKRLVSQLSKSWTDQVIRQGVPFIGNTAEDIQAAFSDHELIRSLGCESIVNMPIRWNGRTVGTLNLHHDKGRYQGIDLPSIASFAQLILPALLQLEREGVHVFTNTPDSHVGDENKK